MQHEITYESEKRRKKMTDEKHEELVFSPNYFTIHCFQFFEPNEFNCFSIFFTSNLHFYCLSFLKNQTQILVCTDCEYSSD